MKSGRIPRRTLQAERCESLARGLVAKSPPEEGWILMQGVYLGLAGQIYEKEVVF